ncbi:RBBP9/YdeN family alpha/beta hydrolase [Saccharopolyspora rectivirgula]|jgi:predicted alpha/beta hydrolase family esterase|uniref:RBBP9/YdeN family alpha/beta hydrolase n=1 Tax=Saccharopolyspora rectivirgula TaxID=28042 RepID=UPI00240A213C|nr:alpha/beta hydrolase [Saccharopolyspora rectivirgula]
MTELRVLVLPGEPDPGPWHWVVWLTRRLREQDVDVRMPLPANTAAPDDRMLVLREQLAAVPPQAELAVVAHSAGAALWLEHAATVEPDFRRADRVLLVAPLECDERLHETGAAAVRRAAGVTRLVVGTGDPQLTMYQARRLAESLQVEMDVVLDGGRLTTASGYGPWPSVLRWVLYGSTPVCDRFEEAEKLLRTRSRQVLRGTASLVCR